MENINVVGFPITGRTQLVITGEHLGLKYKISNHTRHSDLNQGRGIWCYYVYINEHILSDEDFAEFWLPSRGFCKWGGQWKTPSYDYYGHTWSNADWHGDVTFYQKHGGNDGATRVVEIGCDYSHLYDDQTYWELEDIERDVKRTIAKLKDAYSFYEHDRETNTYQPKKTVSDAINDVRSDLAALAKAEGR